MSVFTRCKSCITSRRTPFSYITSQNNIDVILVLGHFVDVTSKGTPMPINHRHYILTQLHRTFARYF